MASLKNKHADMEIGYVNIDTQKWAESIAEMMEEKWKNDIPRPQR